MILKIKQWGPALVMVLSALFAGPALAFDKLDGALTLQQAERLRDGAISEGSVDLPDVSPARSMESPGTRLYRMRFERADLESRLGQPVALLGLLIERACSDLVVRVNGSLVYETPQGSRTRFNECGAPHLATVSWELLHPGVNEIELQVTGLPSSWVATARRSFAISEVHVGEHAKLRDVHRQETGRRVDVPAVVSGGLLLLGLLMSSLLVFPPREPHLGHFTGMCILWAGVAAHGAWSLPVDASLIREGLLVILVAATAWCYERFVCLYADLSIPLLDRLALLQLLVCPLILAVLGAEHLLLTAMIGYSVSAAVAVISTAIFLRHMREPRRRPMLGMGMVLAAGMLMVAIELSISLGLLTAPVSLPLARGIPLCLILVGALQLMQFGEEAHQLEVVQRQLEAKIAMARSEIEDNFSRLAQSRIQQVTSGERKRIAADLHDDLGAKLLTIVHTSRSDRIAALGREALDEMRLSVRGLTGKPMELSEALADWRTEAMARLSPTGIELTWPLPMEEMSQVLGSRTMVQTTRILREIFNNLIRHSHASECEVSTHLDPERLTIEVRDNGIGFDVERLREGRNGLGLVNMAHRARQLQGDCVIESRVGAGSVVRLTLPLVSTAPSSEAAQ